MPDILQPKDIPSYDKICKLSAELIKIREEENRRAENMYGCTLCRSLDIVHSRETGNSVCNFCGYILNTKPTENNLRMAKKRRKDLTKYHWMRRYK